MARVFVDVFRLSLVLLPLAILIVVFVGALTVPLVVSASDGSLCSGEVQLSRSTIRMPAQSRVRI